MSKPKTRKDYAEEFDAYKSESQEMVDALYEMTEDKDVPAWCYYWLAESAMHIQWLHSLCQRTIRKIPR